MMPGRCCRHDRKTLPNKVRREVPVDRSVPEEHCLSVSCEEPIGVTRDDA